MRSVLLASMVGCVAGPAAAQMRLPDTPAGSPAAAAALITPHTVSARIAALAHDSMRGRATPSPELDQAARWIASEFRRFGLTPAATRGGFVQPYSVERSQLDVQASSGAFEGTGRTRLAMSRDFVVVPFNAPRRGTTEGTVLVLAAPQGDTGDPLAGVDLRGKILVQYSNRTDARVMLTVRPEWGEERGLAAIVWVTQASDDVWAAWSGRWNAPRFELADAARGTPLIAVRARAVERVFRAAGVDLAALAAEGQRRPVVRPVPDLSARFTLAPRVHERLQAPNVFGVVRGSDPVLRDEYVVFSAHMDHVGVGRPVNGDSIYNGADDDASGTAGVMSLAEAFAALDPAPRRSLIFLAVSGEERGLWGSEHFAARPPVPIERMVANINLDMIGRNWPDTIVAIGRRQSDLGATLDRVQAAHPDLRMTAVDDLWPAERFYFRSDHYNFARRGVPILFFFNGVHGDYHEPSDHADKIDAEKTARIVKLLFWLGLEVANAAERPKWDEAAYREVVGR